MPKSFIEIRGLDPLLFRDGRPFAADTGEITARSLPLPLPTTLASFVRTQIGNAGGWDWANHDYCLRAHDIPVHGPLLSRDGQIVLPRPKDAHFAGNHTIPTRLEPCAEMAEYCDLPDGLLPVMPPLDVLSTSAPHQRTTGNLLGKCRKKFTYWPKEAMLKWLERSDPGDLEDIAGLPDEERIGIQIDPNLGTAQSGFLYAVRLRSFEEKLDNCRHNYSLIARINATEEDACLPVGSLGGERRLTVVSPVDPDLDMWVRCPTSLKAALSTARRVRMVLATPAMFSDGWRPGWISQSGRGASPLPTGIAKVKLRLVAAAVGHREPVSGWGVRENRPREIRWLAPAGSVYFFEVEDGGDASALWRDSWMQPMSDNEQDRRDGLGLALWGTW